MNKKRMGLFLVILCIILCGLKLGTELFWNGKKSENRDYRVYSRHYVMITGKYDADFWDKVYESALEEGKKQDAYVERLGDNLAVNYDWQELMKIAIDASVDGIIVPGDEEKETVELINRAVDKGIPVVTVLRDSTGSLRQCFVGNNSYNMGQEYGRQVLEILKQNGNKDGSKQSRVLVLTDESKMDNSQNLVLLGLRETLEKEFGKNSPVTVETTLVDNTRSFSPEESIRDIFLNEEGLPDILICLNAVYTQCAYQAAVDYNKVGMVQMLGYYASDTTLNAVAKNIMYSTITLDTEQMGRLCVEALEEYLDTGYTNGYQSVDTRLIRAEDAQKMVESSSEE